MSETEDTATIDALRELARVLGIPSWAIEDDATATRIEELLDRERVGLLRIVRFLADPNAERIVRHFLNVEDPLARRSIADTVAGIAGALAMKKAMLS